MSENAIAARDALLKSYLSRHPVEAARALDANLAQVRQQAPALASSGPRFHGRYGIFTCVQEAVAAARDAFEQLSARPREDRKRIIDHIRRISIDQSVELGTMEMEETQIGRLAHKIEKLRTLGQRTPGVEFLRSEVFSGDHGLAVIEHAPFGVIGAITPAADTLLDAASIRLDVNGQTRQSAPLSDMVHSVTEIIAHLSKLYQLHSGDVIMTGTPAGVGAVVSGATRVGSIDGLEDVRTTIR